jgi:phage terminase large subunit GpA-like protein
MPIRAFGFDSGGEAGVTQQAYSAWRRWRKLDGVVRLIGKIAGRDAWTVLPTKGASALLAQRLVVTYPDTARKSNRAAAGGTVPVAQFNPNSFKDDLSGQLQKADVGEWYVHFPYALRSPEEPHLWFEQLTAETRMKNGRWEKAIKSRRNEALDLMVLTHMMAHLHGLAQIDWAKPPSWAAPWDTNSSLVAGSDAPVPSAPQSTSGPGSAQQKSKSAVHRFR